MPVGNQPTNSTAPNPVEPTTDSPIPPTNQQQPYLPTAQTIVAANQIPEVVSAGKTTVIASAIMLGLYGFLLLILVIIMAMMLASDAARTNTDYMANLFIFVILILVVIVSALVWVWALFLGRKLKKITSTASAAKQISTIFTFSIVMIILSLLSGTIPIAAIIMLIYASKAKDALARYPLT